MKPVGPCPAKIAVVGEAPGENEVMTGVPFMGAAGQELTRMLQDAGIERSSCFLTNVFHEQPPNNILWTTSKKECGHDLPPVGQGKYIPAAKLLPAMERLREELLSARPNVTVALGNTACIALLHAAGISKIRGAVAESLLIPGLKVLPTYHPSAVLRSWELRSIVVLDLVKAAMESEFPEIVYPNRKIFVCETLEDLRQAEAMCMTAPMLALDIETKSFQITCVGFAVSSSEAYVIPLCSRSMADAWTTPELESEAVRTIKRIAESPVPKVGQNGLYDIQWLYQLYGIRVRNYCDDTMIAHHAYMPEAQKGLGFLGTIYTNERSWKLLRPRGSGTEKREE